jgi:hypothetical protein
MILGMSTSTFTIVHVLRPRRDRRFAFPFDPLLPSHVVGMISLVLLAVAIVARYALNLAGAWRRVYVICRAERKERYS